MGSLTANTTAWTNGNVTLTGKARDLGSGISYYQFSTNSGLTSSSSGWTSITNTTAEISKTYTVTKNGTYYFYAKDASGNVNKKSIVVSNIDKIVPTVSVSPTSGKYKKENSNNANITVKISASDSGGSGLNVLQYAWSTSSTSQPTSGWQNFTNGANTTISSQAGKYYLWTKVIDRAGNRATNVQKVGPYIVGGWQKIGGNWYWYDTSTGEKLKGWQYLPGNSGITNDNKYWFYLDPKQDGKMLMGWQLIDGYWYYFLESVQDQCEGAMFTGWLSLGGQWYYLKVDNDGSSWTGPTGSMLKGWQVVGGYWYYFLPNAEGSNKEGSMATGWKLLDGKWYYLKKNGDGVNWSGPTGSMICGSGGGNITVWISNKNYTFNSSGHCLNP